MRDHEEPNEAQLDASPTKFSRPQTDRHAAPETIKKGVSPNTNSWSREETKFAGLAVILELPQSQFPPHHSSTPDFFRLRRNKLCGPMKIPRGAARCKPSPIFLISVRPKSSPAPTKQCARAQPSQDYRAPTGNKTPKPAQSPTSRIFSRCGSKGPVQRSSCLDLNPVILLCLNPTATIAVWTSTTSDPTGQKKCGFRDIFQRRPQRTCARLEGRMSPAFVVSRLPLGRGRVGGGPRAHFHFHRTQTMLNFAAAKSHFPLHPWDS